jgi:prepilin-type N-terminal cleavage/methylation domain-containing protein
MRTIRPGYTLIEIMCVVAIVVAVTAIGTPLLQSMLVDAHISAAADMVRGRLADTRSKALDEGRSWRLGFLPGTGSFQLAPDDSQEWETVTAGLIRQPDLIRDELPKDIIFGLNQGDVLSAAGAGAPGSKWETIAVYKWDGSANDDSTIYFGKGGLVPMRVNVRSLTGAVSIEVPMNVKDQP